MNDIPNILIVDDKKQNLIALEKTLRETDANIIKALNGDEALRASLKHDFALAILDVQMPGMDGYELAEYLREEERMRTLPIIFLSAVHSDEYHVFRGYEAGAVDYIVKPYEPSILLSKVNVFLELHKQKAELQVYKSELTELVDERTKQLKGTMAELRQEISERKRAEKELFSAVQRWQSTFDAITDIVTVISPSHEFIEINQIGCDILGKKKEDLIGKKCYELVHGLDEPLEDCPCDRAILTKKVEYGETKENGRHYSINAWPILDENDEVLAFTHVVKDITERKKAKEYLKQYESMVSSSSDMIALLDKDFTYLACNEAYVGAFGMRKDQVIGHTVSDVFGEEFFETVIRSNAESCLAGDEIHYSEWFEFPIKGRFFMDISYFPYVTNEDKVNGFVVFARNATGRKKYEDEIEKLARFPSENPNPVVRVAKGGTIIYANQASAPLLDLWECRTGECLSPEWHQFALDALDAGEIKHTEMVSGDKTFAVVYAPVPESDYINMYGLDITERKRAEQALQKERDFAESILETAQVIILMLDVDGQIVHFNPYMEEISGYSLAEVIGKDWFGTFLPVKDQATIRDVFRKGIDDIQTKGFVNSIVTKNGSKREIEWYNKTIKDTDQNIIGLLSIGLDITERKQAEERLRKNEAQLSNAMEIAKLGYWEYDVDSDLFTFNDHFYDIFRTTAEKVGGYTMTPTQYAERFLHPDDRAVVAREIKKAFETTDPNFTQTIDHRIMYADGETGYISVRSFILKDEKGRTIRTYGANQDITERKQIEENLLVSEEKHRRLFESSADAIMTLEPPEWMFTSGNPASLDMFCAISEEDFISRSPWEYSPERQPDGRSSGDKAREMIETALCEGSHFFEWQHKRLDGEEFPATVLLTRFELDDQIILQDTVRDISEIKRAEQEKTLLEAQLRQSQKLESIGTLAGGVAHEINNPLMGIINYGQLINNRVQDEKLKQFSAGIIKEGNRVDKIVKNLLSFARMDKQSHSPALLEDIIDASLNLIGSLLRKDQITIELEIPDDLPKIKCRSQQIEQVIINLLTNARDALNSRYEGYHENKIVKISAKSFEKDGVPWVRTIVEDHGTGMSPDVIARIFDPFFTTKSKAQGSVTDAKNPMGTGLGLSVSYGIIKEHNGTLSVESEPGEYSRFIIDLRVNNGWSLRGDNTGVGTQNKAMEEE